jgi:hypothetical protein
MPKPRRQERCPVCKGTKFIDAVDNFANHYKACATCKFSAGETQEIGRGVWVPLTETRPPIDEPLLVWCRADVYGTGEIHQHPQSYIARLSWHGEWQCLDEGTHWNWHRILFDQSTGECLITHWMHLPGPPG